MRPILFFCFLLAGNPILWGQFHQPVLPNQSGQTLLNSLEDQYRPAFTLNNSAAKDTLYARIYALNDSVACVYSGHKSYLPPGQDPSQAVFDNNINLEHTYPKSKGVDNTLAENDMHHLYPSRADVNNDRGSHPFLELNDNQTERWYYLDQTITNIPSSQIDRYSEAIINDRFEPREDHKGNAARAVFYIYTIYNGDVTSADPDFFEIQRETLCEWHYQDPVDSLEWVRNQLIASYQDDTPNPFILDCTLAARTYCADVTGECLGINNTKKPPSAPIELTIFPNPTSEMLHVKWENIDTQNSVLSILDNTGRIIRHLDISPLQQAFTINIQDLSPGMYQLQLSTAHFEINRKFVVSGK